MTLPVCSSVRIKGQTFDFYDYRSPSLFANRAVDLVYVGNAKSGCTSIKNALFYADRGFMYPEPENIHASYYAFWVWDGINSTPDAATLFDVDTVFTFSVVRHPFKRFVSGFVDKLMPRGQAHYAGPRDFLTGYLGIDLGGDPVRAAVAFLEWLEQDELPLAPPGQMDPHFRPQSKNLAIDRSFPLDFIGKLEEPAKIWTMFEERSGRSMAPFAQTRFRMVDHPAKDTLLQSAELKTVVRRVYAADYENFGYD